MLLKSFSVKKLFGTFTYSINFNLDTKVYVITGPNGYGKTTILRMLHSLCHKEKLLYFYEVPFEEITVEYDNGTTLIITKKKLTDISSGDQQVITEEKTLFTLNRRGRALANYSIDSKKYEQLNETFEDSPNKKDKFFLLFQKERNREFHDAELDKLSMNLAIVKDTYVPSQRLVENELEEELNEREERSISKIEKIAESLQKNLEDCYMNFLKYSQQRDSKFIDQLLNATTYDTKKEYEEKFEKLNIQIKELNNYGLLNKTIIRPYDVKHKRELSVYLHEQELKVAQYNPIRKKLNLFLSLLNEKKFVNKEFSFSVSKGLRVKLMKSNSYLKDLSKLSSGEQNEIILLYTLIFGVPDDSLLLIDEPELSLHVAWQLQFINDVQRVAKDKNVQIIIATHSAAIAGNYDEEPIELVDLNTEK